MKKFSVRFSVLASCILALSATQVAPASAGQGIPSPASHAYSSVTPACTQEVMVGMLGAPREGQQKPANCYHTRAQAFAALNNNPALAALSDAQVADLDGSRGDTPALNATNNVSPSICINCTGFSIGADYKDTHNSGSAIIYWYGPSYCYPGSYFYSGMPSDWNDVVSSSHLLSASKCNSWKHWENTYTGKLIDCGLAHFSCYDYYLPDGSSMSDKTSTE